MVAVSARAHSSRTTEGLALSGAFPPVDLRSIISNLILKSLEKFRARKKIIRRDKVILWPSNCTLEREVQGTLMDI